MYRRLLELSFFAVVVTCCLSAPLSAGKPGGGGGGGPQPTGTISFWADGNWTMNADGSNKQPNAGLGLPSHSLHDGYQWHLSTWPHPTTGVNQLAIVREDGAPASILYTGIPESSLLYLRWSKDDSFISFSGGPDLSVVGSEVGIYAATVDWSGGSPVLSSAFAPIVTGTVTATGEEISPWFDWSPDGTALVYIRWNNDYLLRPFATVLDLFTNEETVLAVADGPMDWSPDGSRIALRIQESSASLSGIYTVAPDATGLTQLTAEGKSRDEVPVWSPDSNYLVFTRRQTNRSGALSGNLLRISAQGGKTVSLTSDMPSSNKYPVAWR